MADGAPAKRPRSAGLLAQGAGAVEGEFQALVAMLDGTSKSIDEVGAQLGERRRGFTKQFAELQGTFQATHASVVQLRDGAKAREQRLASAQEALLGMQRAAAEDLAAFVRAAEAREAAEAAAAAPPARRARAADGLSRAKAIWQP
eukprot:SRR837773.9009.p3 GENE.SRR837773.9009~~SRR837773.9009.p3  ORF type:complete len:163 (+),score=46.76 SRR837773.9009:53-490(+)